MIIATSGHVDHGKTLLVHVLSGIETDRLEEEKERGLTIDLGFAYMHQRDQTIGFIDVPGHIKFINNMLSGVAAIDFGMVVIAADDGPMPQTREHLAILDLLGLDTGCIALTKIDRVDKTRLIKVKEEIKDLIKSTSFRNAPIYPVSSTSLSGITALKDALWAAAEKVKTKSTQGHFRLAIDRCFTVKGAGVVVTGSVFSGKLAEGDELTIYPQNKTVRVRSIHRQNQSSNHGYAGDRCAINLAGDISRDQISRGNWLSSSPELPYTDRIDLQFNLLSSESRPLTHWMPIHIHNAAQHVTGRIATLESKAIQPGEKQLVQLVLAEPINACYGDRIIIRDQSASRTLGGGRVIDPFSPQRGRAKPERIEFLKAMLAPEESARIKSMLAHSASGIKIAQVQSSFNSANLNLEQYGVLDSMGNLYARESIDKAKQALIVHLDAWHQANVNETGLTDTQLINISKLPKSLAQCAVKILIQEKKIDQSGNKLKKPGSKIQMAGPEMALWKKVEPLLSKDILRPPVLHDIAKTVNLPPAATEKLLNKCIKHGLVVKPTKNRFFLPAAIAELKKIAIELASKTQDGKFTVIEFRDQAGIGRNLCIEILEHFDQTGFTRRLADQRVIQDVTR